jgi:hypothetical protein
MDKLIKIWLILVILLGIVSIAFVFYKTIIKNDYETVDLSSVE